MSKIEEIRTRHMERTQQLARLGPIAQYEATAEQAHQDRATLLAALDGEWQSERPEEGALWLSMHPDMRGKRPAVMPVELKDGWVWLSTFEMPLTVNAPELTGALWQRRTVPADPFKGGGA